MRRSAADSIADGSARSSIPSPTRTRQVVQRARPPHTEACGIPAARIASNIVWPIGAETTCPDGCEIWYDE